MANNCFYRMVAVAPKRETLERLIDIMNYKDNEYFIYRCFHADVDEITFGDGLYRVSIWGDVAWSTMMWFEQAEDTNNLLVIGYEGNDFSRPIYGTAHFISLDLLCEILDFGVEIFAEESGCCFQSYDACTHTGEYRHDVADWIEDWCDEDGNELDEPHTEGGLYYYGDFNSPSVIYG